MMVSWDIGLCRYQPGAAPYLGGDCCKGEGAAAAARLQHQAAALPGRGYCQLAQHSGHALLQVGLQLHRPPVAALAGVQVSRGQVGLPQLEVRVGPPWPQGHLTESVF